MGDCPTTPSLRGSWVRSAGSGTGRYPLDVSDTATLVMVSDIGSAGGDAKRQRVTLSTVKGRGWTAATIRELLGDPDAMAPNLHYRSAGAPMKLYYLDRVVAIEQTQEFRDAKQKADQRRESSRKGLAAARAVLDAQAVINTESDLAASQAAAENWAVKHAVAALDTTWPMTTQLRRRLSHNRQQPLRRARVSHVRRVRVVPQQRDGMSTEHRAGPQRSVAARRDRVGVRDARGSDHPDTGR